MPLHGLWISVNVNATVQTWQLQGTQADFRHIKPAFMLGRITDAPDDEPSTYSTTNTQYGRSPTKHQVLRHLHPAMQ